MHYIHISDDYIRSNSTVFKKEIKEVREILNLPAFGIIISILAYETGLFLYRKTKFSLFNPIFISIILVIAFLSVFKIKLESYNIGGNYISFFLGPATVILAVPLYKQLENLKADIIPILGGITAGCITAVSSASILMVLFKLSKTIGISLIPKSVTTPIGIEISKQIGGIPSITIFAIIITGIFGAIIGPFICRVFKIKDPVAVGVALGTSSHAIGTTKAIELGEVQGAMSGLSIGIAGLITVFLAPLAMKFL
jgi:predicted murein hydrolase (TIGR00659 family)